jgi:hypothetical protein
MAQMLIQVISIIVYSTYTDVPFKVALQLKAVAVHRRAYRRP